MGQDRWGFENIHVWTSSIHLTEERDPNVWMVWVWDGMGLHAYIEPLFNHPLLLDDQESTVGYPMVQHFTNPLALE